MRESSLSAEQCEALKPFVEGKVIHDLGCGPMLLTKELLALGTTHIVAIDKEPIWPGLAAPGITFEKKHFNEMALSAEMNIFLGRPDNRFLPGLLELVAVAKQVIYFGCNRGGTQCGFPALFKLFLHRELLCHVPGQNSLIVCGGYRQEPREPTVEELAGIDTMTLYDIQGQRVR